MSNLVNLEELFTDKNEKLVCLEVNPPRGSNLDAIFAKVDGDNSGIDYFNVTDCALAKLRMSGVAFATLLKRRFNREVLLNFSCRDRNLIALQSDLIGAEALGVSSIVALTGDALSLGDFPEAKAVFEINSCKLLEIISSLNSGSDCQGGKLNCSTKLTPGAVINPNAKNSSSELKRFEKKVKSGAKYALSQPVFESESAHKFFLEFKRCFDLPVLVGLLPLKSLEAAKAICNVPGIRISDAIVEDAAKLPVEAIESYFDKHLTELAKSLNPLVRGFHIVSGATPSLAIRFARGLKKRVKI